MCTLLPLEYKKQQGQAVSNTSQAVGWWEEWPSDGSVNGDTCIDSEAPC